MKLLAGVAPNMTTVTPEKFLPVTVTVVAPAEGPSPGATCVTTGGFLTGT